MDRRSSAGKTRRVALTAMLAGLSLIFLYAASALPTGRLGLTAVAGLFPAAAVVAFGLPAGFLCYGGTAILALLLAADKGLALLYLLFFGLYPMVKGAAEKIGRLWAELAIKIAFFNGVFSLFLFFLRTVFFSVAPVEGLPVWGVYLGGNLVFLAYDFGFSKLICLYRTRIDRVLRNR